MITDEMCKGKDMLDLNWFAGKRMLITGHTGFKGSWMCKVLLLAGAKVTGYSLEAPTNPSLYHLAGLEAKPCADLSAGSPLTPEDYWNTNCIYSVIGDVRDLAKLKKVFDEVQPEIVIHMAAQPIVRESYKDPVGTYETNVMGTVNVLECVRTVSSVRSFVNVTTDKVYLNKEWPWGYRENEELNGFDPYSNSKSCSELVTSSYKNSFFGGDSGIMPDGRQVAISTMRAGNVIGGGDFATDRIIPDCIRAVEEQKEIVVRNPYSTRPYQHVLEPVMAYLMVAQHQYKDITLAGNYNVGPDDVDCFSTGNIVDLFCECWNQDSNNKHEYAASWKNVAEANAPHEANFLKLDCAKIKTTFGWQPVWNLHTVMEKIVEWTRIYFAYKEKEELSDKIAACMEKQIKDFIR